MHNHSSVHGKPLKNNLKGFTLIELVVVIAILGIVAAIASRMISSGFMGYIDNQQLINADSQLRIALERMQRDIRAIPSPTSIISATGTSLSFTDTNGNSVTYSLSANTLMRAGQPLAYGIQSLTLNYFDRNGAETTTPATIRYISFTLNVIQGDANFTAGTSVYARNLQ